MTIQTVGGVLAIPQDFGPLNLSFTAHLIDSLGEKFEMVFPVPKTGTISKVGFRTGTVTTAQTLRAGLQALTSGDANGTAYGGMVAGTQAGPASNTFYLVTLGTGATATIGDVIAAVVEFDGTEGSLNLVSESIIGGGTPSGFPYVGLYTTAWTKTANFPILAIEYSDGSYYYIGAIPASVSDSINYNNGSTPDEYALRINVPFPLRVWGAWVYADIDNAADVVLYEGTTAQRTISLSSANRASTSFAPFRFPFTSSFTLSANTTYYLSLKPTTASNIYINRMTMNTAAAMGQLPLGINAYQATRTDAGSWSTDAAVRPWMGLLVDGIDDGAGGAGGGGPLIGGRLVL